MDFKESCNLHILSLSFVWYSCSFYLIMLWVGGVWKSINKCSNYSLTCLCSRLFHRVTFLSELIFWSFYHICHTKPGPTGTALRIFLQTCWESFPQETFLYVSKAFVCFENKPIVILLLLLFVILIALFSMGKARFQEFGTNQVGGGGRFVPFSLFFPQVGPDPSRCCAPSLLREARGGASVKYSGAERSSPLLPLARRSRCLQWDCARAPRERAFLSSSVAGEFASFR